MDHNEKCKLTSTSAKLCITSLNSHFCFGDNGTTCWYGAKGARVWIKVCNPHSALSVLSQPVNLKMVVLRID